MSNSEQPMEDWRTPGSPIVSDRRRNHPFCSRKYKWAVSVHPSKNIITQQRQPAKHTLYLRTSLLRGGGSQSVPPEEKHHLANVFTRKHGHLPSYSPYHAFSYTFLDLADDASQWPGALACQNNPCISGLTYHPGHCDDCSFFSPKCSESCDSGWLAFAW